MKTILTVALLGCAMLGAHAQSGDFGENNALHWEIVDGTLTISGTGDMPDPLGLLMPWDYYTYSHVVIENGVTGIGSEMFQWNLDIRSVTIPESVTKIGRQAFYHCSYLSTVYFNAINCTTTGAGGIFSYCHESLSIYFGNKVEAIPAWAFYDCDQFTSFTIPNSVTSIGIYAFFLCDNLTSITISENVTSIGDGAFGLTGLTSVIIPNSVTSIGNYAFESCSNLTSVTIGNSVTSIGLGAFEECRNLTSVTIGNSVTSIGPGAFESCSNLTSVTNLNADPQNIAVVYYYDVFYNVNISAATLYVPSGSKSAYQSAPFWQDFGNIVEIYTPVTQPYSNTMTITAAVVLDEVELQSGQIEISAFVDGECRGAAWVQHYPESILHPYLGFLTIYGNENGENITFKVRDYDANTEYAADFAGVSPILFDPDAVVGNADNPFLIPIFTPLAIRTQEIPLNEGWSWFSVNVTNNDPSLLTQFKDNIGASGMILKDRSDYIQEPYWIGTLHEITNTDMYMVETTAAHTLPFTGVRVDPAAAPITLLNGWNWIGYTPQAGLPVDEALADLNPQNGDQVKSYSEYSTFTNGQGWVGSLETMNPGNGYKYYSTNATAQAFAYPSTTILKSSASKESLPLRWVTPANRYPNNMTCTFVVSQDNVEWQNDQIEIGAFCGGECRGSVRLSYLPQLPGHPYIGFLVIYGEGNEDIQLKLYDHTTGKEYAVGNHLMFFADAICGNPSEPYRVVASTTGICNVAFDAVAVFLDATGEQLHIRYPWSSIDRVELVDLNGRILWQETGFASESVSVSTLVKGMYLLKLVKDNQVSVYRVVK